MAFPLAGIASAVAGGMGLGGRGQAISLLDPFGKPLVTFDTVLGETYGCSATPTSFPVEDGASISDHIVRAPLTFDMLGIVSDTPLQGREALITEAYATAATAVLPPLGVVATGAAVSLWKSQQNAPSRSQAAYATLHQLAYGDPEQGEDQGPALLTVATKLRALQRMMIADMQVQRDASGGPWLGFALKFVQVVVVQSQTLTLSQLDNPALGAAQKQLGERQSQLAKKYIQGRVDGLGLIGEGG